MENSKVHYWNERWAKLDYHLEMAGKDYFFSDYGRIKSVDKESGKEKFLRGSKLKQGFRMLNVYLKDAAPKRFFIHKLIAEKWIKKEHEGQTYAVHLDRNTENNFYGNIKWMSQEEKTAFLKENGSFDPQKKKRNPHYKLNSARVQLIRKRLKESNNRRKIIAKEFGISVGHLKRIEDKKLWGWVEDIS